MDSAGPVLYDEIDVLAPQRHRAVRMKEVGVHDCVGGRAKERAPRLVPVARRPTTVIRPVPALKAWSGPVAEFSTSTGLRRSKTANFVTWEKPTCVRRATSC